MDLTAIDLLLTPANISTALIVMNFLAFAAFGLDKFYAENGRRRISEASLLHLAFLGGIAGAYAGRAAFRHKTKKQSFTNQLHKIAVFQLCACVFLVVFFW